MSGQLFVIYLTRDREILRPFRMYHVRNNLSPFNIIIVNGSHFMVPPHLFLFLIVLCISISVSFVHLLKIFHIGGSGSFSFCFSVLGVSFFTNDGLILCLV